MSRQERSTLAVHQGEVETISEGQNTMSDDTTSRSSKYQHLAEAQGN